MQKKGNTYTGNRDNLDLITLRNKIKKRDKTEIESTKRSSTTTTQPTQLRFLLLKLKQYG